MIIKGDISGNGKIDYEDQAILQAYNLGIIDFNASQYRAADINSDSDVTLTDLAALSNMLRGVNIINEVIE